MFICITLGLASGSADSLFAQGAPELAIVYGRGVHAFFASDTNRADELFTEAINSGLQDPRVYYFRGITRLRQGRQYEAEADLRMGAALEARDPGRRHAIGTALQRIQGTDRQTLERFRREGRLLDYQGRRGLNQQRYEQLRSRESHVLHKDASVPMEDLVTPSIDKPTIPSTESSNTGQIEKTQPTPAVSAAETPKPREQAVAPPAQPAETTTEDPFGSAPAEKPPVVEEDPFGEPAKTEAKPVPADEPESNDPFGSTSDAPDSKAPSTPAPAPAPAEETPADDDPFGAPATADPAPAKVESAPAAKEPVAEDDLFSTEPAVEPKPAPAAAEAAEDDPFGAPVESPSEAGSSTTEDAPQSEPSPAPADEAPAPSEDDPFGFGIPEDEAESTADDPFGEPATEQSADEETLEEDVAHEEDAEAAEDMEAGEAAEVTGSLEGEPASDDPFAESVDETAAEEQPMDEETADSTPESEDSSSEDSPAEDAPEEEKSDEESPEPSTDVDDPFGGF